MDLKGDGIGLTDPTQTEKTHHGEPSSQMTKDRFLNKSVQTVRPSVSVILPRPFFSYTNLRNRSKENGFVATLLSKKGLLLIQTASKNIILFVHQKLKSIQLLQLPLRLLLVRQLQLLLLPLQPLLQLLPRLPLRQPRLLQLRPLRPPLRLPLRLPLRVPLRPRLRKKSKKMSSLL